MIYFWSILTLWHYSTIQPKWILFLLHFEAPPTEAALTPPPKPEPHHCPSLYLRLAFALPGTLPRPSAPHHYPPSLAVQTQLFHCPSLTAQTRCPAHPSWEVHTAVRQERPAGRQLRHPSPTAGRGLQQGSDQAGMGRKGRHCLLDFGR